MLEASYGLNFFLKTHPKGFDLRYIYLRITVDGIQKETSTKRKWEASRWNQKKMHYGLYTKLVHPISFQN